MKRLAGAVAAMLACASVFAAQPVVAPTYTITLMTPELALKAAQAAIAACRQAGYQVAAAVVDRTGQTQVMLRDRLAGIHTPEAATAKAWTAASFKTDTTALARATQSGTESSGIRQIPRALAVGGGLMIEAGGVLFGAIGISGAPNGAADDACARAGIAAIAEELEF
jgi:uncharacterized protein GlcG (DUF336 family)